MESRYCPYCGMPVKSGSVYPCIKFYGRGLAVLRWKSDEEVPRKKPITLFGRVISTTRPLEYTLLEEDTSLATSPSPPGKADGWYCPACKKVFAVFDVPKSKGGS